MFAVIYKFIIKENTESQFVDSWINLTQLIRIHEGGLGSRLHRVKKNTFIAYAQWPNEETWKSSGNKLPPSGIDIKLKMRDCCESIDVKNTLQIIKNH
jgi:hypothetical protein